MNKNLPRVYVSPINKELRNNEDIYYSDLTKPEKKPEVNVLKSINEIFASPHHVYKSKVKITTKDNVIDTILVGKTTTDLLALDGTKIKINDILNIEKI